MAGAFEIVMQERKALVDKIIGMMKQGDFFHNASEWDRDALRPQNPMSKIWYRGGNRMKLMAVVTEKGYRDPRWTTAKQLFDKGYHITEADLGISLRGEHYEDHSDYLRSWIGALENDYNEFFRACADAEQIAKRLVGNYTKKYELKMEVEGLPEQDAVITEPETVISGRSR